MASCSNKGADPDTDSTGTSTGAGTTTGGQTGSTRTLDAYTTQGASVTTDYGGSCTTLVRDTRSCQSAREALGLSGNWLKFSCNVVIGLANSSNASVTSLSSATYITLTAVDLPDHPSNYFPTSGTYSFTANGVSVTGNYSSLYSAYSPSFPNPGTIGSQSYVMFLPIATTSSHSAMGGGPAGLAINGVAIFGAGAANQDNIFAEAGSFDQCQGHPAGTAYHYHSEPYAISHDDNALIGVMKDGYFVYGRRDYDGSTPGSRTQLIAAGGVASSTLYQYGGHVGPDPLTGTGNVFHYHLTEWKGCYHESGRDKLSDDGATYDDGVNSPVITACGGTWVDAWFIGGHGNGGVFETNVTALSSGQTPSQRTAGARYFYGTPGPCTGCDARP